MILGTTDAFVTVLGDDLDLVCLGVSLNGLTLAGEAVSVDLPLAADTQLTERLGFHVPNVVPSCVGYNQILWNLFK
jgi:hypothetical protein